MYNVLTKNQFQIILTSSQVEICAAYLYEIKNRLKIKNTLLP